MPDNGPLPTNPLAAVVAADIAANPDPVATIDPADGPTDAEIAAQLKGEAPPPAPEETGPSKAEEYLARVVKQQKRLQAEKRALKEERERNAQALRAAEEYQELQRLAQADPLAAHQKLNLNADQLIRRMVEEGEKNRPLSVEQRLDRMEQQRLADMQAAQEAQRQQAQAMHNQELDYHVSNYKGAVEELAKANVERYELISTYGQANRVWNEALAYYKVHKSIPAPEVVMDMVEQDLRNDLKQLLSTSYFRTLVQEYQGKSKPPSPVSTRTPRPASLTNSIARLSGKPLKTEDEETDEDREKAAIAILSGLKQ
jgi:hypothetical protein